MEHEFKEGDIVRFGRRRPDSSGLFVVAETDVPFLGLAYMTKVRPVGSDQTSYVFNSQLVRLGDLECE